MTIQKYEYTVFRPKMTLGFTQKKFNIDQLTQDLNFVYGQDGWELVSVVPISGNSGISWGGSTVGVMFIFKRPLI
jgi:hypothetical protein